MRSVGRGEWVNTIVPASRGGGARRRSLGRAAGCTAPCRAVCPVRRSCSRWAAGRWVAGRPPGGSSCHRRTSGCTGGWAGEKVTWVVFAFEICQGTETASTKCERLWWKTNLNNCLQHWHIGPPGKEPIENNWLKRLFRRRMDKLSFVRLKVNQSVQISYCYLWNLEKTSKLFATWLAVMHAALWPNSGKSQLGLQWKHVFSRQQKPSEPCSIHISFWKSHCSSGYWMIVADLLSHIQNPLLLCFFLCGFETQVAAPTAPVTNRTNAGYTSVTLPGSRRGGFWLELFMMDAWYFRQYSISSIGIIGWSSSQQQWGHFRLQLIN